MRLRASAALLLVAASLGASLAGCAAQPSASQQSDHGPIRVVASTSVYGDIAKTIGGGEVSVTSIISDPSQDPHSFEGGVRTELAVSRAAVVVRNGGGYDDFLGVLLRGSGNSRAVVVDAVSLSGYDRTPNTGEFNEHVWYDIHTVRKVAEKLAKDFGSLHPEAAATFTANAARFDDSLQELEALETTIAAGRGGGQAFMATEPVPDYLLEACGLIDRTPKAFAAAVEAETDVSPAVLQRTLTLFSTRKVALLAYNTQTSGPQVAAVAAAAKKGGVPVVPVTETLPVGKHYVDWMRGTITAVATALAEEATE